MSLPRIALFSDSEYAALRVGVLREGKEKDFTRTITVKTVMVCVGVYHRNFLLLHLYSVEVFIVRKSWKVLMMIRTDNGCCVRLWLQLVWFRDCRKTKDNLSFLLLHVSWVFRFVATPPPPAPAVSHNCITSSFILPQTLDLSSFLACVPMHDTADYPTVLYSKAVVWLIFPLVVMPV